MISRSTALALVFASFATLSLAGVARVQRSQATPTPAPAAKAVYQLPRVVVTGKIVKSDHDAPAGN